MNVYSVMTKLLRPTNENSAAFDVPPAHLAAQDRSRRAAPVP